jgi:hypothetical protein
LIEILLAFSSVAIRRRVCSAMSSMSSSPR